MIHKCVISIISCSYSVSKKGLTLKMCSCFVQFDKKKNLQPFVCFDLCSVLLIISAYICVCVSGRGSISEGSVVSV